MSILDQLQGAYDARMPPEDDCREEIYWHHVDEEEAIICDDVDEALDAVWSFFSHSDEWSEETINNLASVVGYNISVPFHMRNTPIALVIKAATRWKAEQTVINVYGPRE